MGQQPARRRAWRGRLPIISGAQLPDLGWYSDRPLLRADFAPIELGEPKESHSDLTTKPRGGLWCSPMVRIGREVYGTSWTNYVADASAFLDRGGPLQRVHPRRNAKVLVINELRHLQAAIDRWPDRRMPRFDFAGTRWTGRWKPSVPDWTLMAQEIDAVYVTANGIEATNGMSPPFWPSLPMWDVATVLFLQPAFAIGRTIQLGSLVERKAAYLKAMHANFLDWLKQQAMEPDQAKAAQAWMDMLLSDDDEEVA